MLIIADSRMPETAKIRLQSLGEVLWLEPQPQLYVSIAAHPDIFFCQLANKLFASPSLPNHWEKALAAAKIEVVEGQSKAQGKYPETAAYNAVVADNYLIHNLKITDEILLSQFDVSRRIHVNQGYTRCNLLALGNNYFLTSDKGIEKVLVAKGKKVLFINPKQIILQGENYGFIGGVGGICEQLLFLCGNHQQLAEADAFESFVNDAGFEIVNLYDGPLLDVGSILFVEI